MRKLVYITGVLSFSITSIGILFKTLHLPGGAMILLFSTIIFALIFVPSTAIYNYKRAK